MDVMMDVVESNYNHARMRAMRTLYARDANAICARHENRPPGGATLGGLREMQRTGALGPGRGTGGSGCVKTNNHVGVGGQTGVRTLAVESPVGDAGAAAFSRGRGRATLFF